MILCHTLFPLGGVAWLGYLVRNAVCVPVSDETSVSVLCLDVAVNVFYEKKLLECDPSVEDFLCIVP